MKSKVIFAALVASLFLFGCASNQGPNLANNKFTQFTHSDLMDAAVYAEANGYPARGAVYRAVDVQLTACEQALAASAPKQASGVVGAFTAFEVSAEAVGNGVPAAVKLNCSAVQLPSGLLIVK